MTNPKRARHFRTREARNWLAGVYDRLYSNSLMRAFEKCVIFLSAAGFLAHLALIFVARNFAPQLSGAAGQNYLAAIYTPFSIVLIYEVLVLISAIPQPPSESVATQFEIVSLIFVRGFFHEIGALDLDRLQTPTLDVLLRLLDDIGGGLILFALITVFKRAARQPELDDPAEHLVERETFVLWKKVIALAVTGVFMLSAASAIRTVLGAAYRLVVRADSASSGADLFFYNNVFTTMIFTDVLILILSLVLSGQYESVFRNAAFVVSRTLMRFSLLAQQPNKLIFATAGIVFAILTIVVYNYGRKRENGFRFGTQRVSDAGVRRALR